MSSHTNNLARELLPYVGGVFVVPLVSTAPILAGWVALDSPIGQIGLFFGAISPSLVALGRAAFAARRQGRPRIPPAPQAQHWLKLAGLSGLALLLPAIVSWLGVGIYAGITHPASLSWLVAPALLPLLKAVTVSTFGEEWGWRGYLLPRLQQRMSPLLAGLLVGIVWALWHYWYFLLPGWFTVSYVWFFADVLGESLWFTWFYNQSSGNIWLAVFFHITGNFWAHLIPLEQGDGGAITPHAIFGLLFLVTGLLVIIFAHPSQGTR